MLEKTHTVQDSVTTGVFLYTGRLQQRLTRSHLDPTCCAWGQACAAVSGPAAGQSQPDSQNPLPAAEVTSRTSGSRTLLPPAEVTQAFRQSHLEQAAWLLGLGAACAVTAAG